MEREGERNKFLHILSVFLLFLFNLSLFFSACRDSLGMYYCENHRANQSYLSVLLNITVKGVLFYSYSHMFGLK